MRVKNLIKAVCSAMLCAAVVLPHTAIASPAQSFAQNPVVYFAITDRFYNGNPDNDNSYGRQKDGDKEIGTFHGGDLAGITQKLKEGYFSKLGVNAIWITAPYEQIHGWVVGGKNEFKHYAYHGYFALDYTVLDKNMGTADELKTMIDTAHAQGIRILFDVVMNHPGYGDLQTMSEYKVGVVADDWQKANLKSYHSYIDYNSEDWQNWWGGDWVRAGLPTYPDAGSSDLTMQLDYLPDFRTDSKDFVRLPEFFKYKKDTKAKNLPNATVTDYLVTWLSQWVRDYGVDGFRCDTAKHVDLAAWAALKRESTLALAEWKKNNPSKKIDDAPFWMVGEVFPHGVEKDAYYTKGKFDSLINFTFQDNATDVAQWDSIFSDYAQRLNDEEFDVLSYISSHDTQLADRKQLWTSSTGLMLLPGGVQIYYGDETARPAGPFSRGDKQQRTRSSMNWSSIDQNLLEHWQKLGQFRQAHPAIARGQHQKISDTPYVFTRTLPQDQVVIAVGVTQAAEIPVAKVFANGSKIKDAYTNTVLTVQDGMVQVDGREGGVVLLEAI